MDSKVSRLKNGVLIFKDYPDFQPNLTPDEVILGGAWCNGYFRKVYSQCAGRYLQTADYKKYAFLKDLPADLMTKDIDVKHDHSVNKFGKHCSMPLQYWEEKGWIKGKDYRGWFQWYCEFYSGRRQPETDKWQINRWKKIASHKSGRFRHNLVRQIHDKPTKWNDETISPIIRQALWHWAYQLTKKDYDDDVQQLLEKRAHSNGGKRRSSRRKSRRSK